MGTYEVFGEHSLAHCNLLSVDCESDPAFWPFVTPPVRGVFEMRLWSDFDAVRARTNLPLYLL